jgi:hypothetical protein
MSDEMAAAEQNTDEIVASIDSGARYQARIALVTAIVALVSALLGPLVSLKINSDQIKSQGKQASSDSVAASQQSEREFVRTQRSTAYSTLLTDFNNATLDLIGAAGFFSSADQNTPVDTVAQQQQAAVKAVKDVTAAYYQVKIVASDDTAAAADNLYGEFGTWSGTLLTIIGKLFSGERLTSDDQALLAGTNDEYVKLLGLSNEFIKVGRVDMASDVDTKKKK